MTTEAIEASAVSLIAKWRAEMQQATHDAARLRREAGFANVKAVGREKEVEHLALCIREMESLIERHKAIGEK